jgi:hypothetical protein
MSIKDSFTVLKSKKTKLSSLNYNQIDSIIGQFKISEIEKELNNNRNIPTSKENRVKIYIGMRKNKESVI